MESSICRVCLEQKENMLNVFQATPVSGIPISSMISQWSGYPVTLKDPFPKTICQPCVQDAHSAYKMDQAHWQNDSAKEEVVEEKEANEGERANQFDIQLKEEIIDDSQCMLEPTDDLCRFSGDSHDNLAPPYVRSEPIVEDNENDCPNSNCKLEQETSNLETQQKPKNKKNKKKPSRNTAETQQKPKNNNKKKMEKIKRPECPKQLPSKRLEQHAVTHQEGRPFQCPVCAQTFKLFSYLKAHNWVHFRNPPPYNCPHCPSSFTQYPNFMLHLKVHKTALK